jgi:AbrB family looped-hinge helix DNA binding protein
VTVKVSQKGWIVIPAALRQKYGLKPGADLVVVDYGGVLALVPAFKDAVKEGAGLLKDRKATCKDNDSLTQTIVDEHRAEVDRDR